VAYVDVHDIDQQPDNEVLFDFLAQLNGLPVPARPAPPPAAETPTADVVLYCTPWCPSCPRARTYLKERGIAYVEVDISRDREAARRVRGWANGNETTPTFDVKGTVVVDFDRPRLEQALKILDKAP
jgi:glutaredoxin 3